MSLVPQVHFNFGPTSFDRFYQVLLPIIPGGVFVGKWLWNRPDLVLSMRDALGLSPYATVPVFVFIAYVAGFVLFASSGIFTGIVSGVAQGLLFRRWVPLRSSATLSKCTNWRLVAGKFLDELKPSTPEPQPPSAVMDKILKPMKDLANKRDEDVLWEEWYRILQDYLLRDTPIISNDSFFISVAVEATGWVLWLPCVGLAWSVIGPCTYWRSHLSCLALFSRLWQRSATSATSV